MIGMLIWDRAGHGLRPVRMKEISVLHVRFLCGEVTALERTAAVARSHRLRTAGRRLLRQGVERVVLPEGSAADVLPKGLRPVSTLRVSVSSRTPISRIVHPPTSDGITATTSIMFGDFSLISTRFTFPRHFSPFNAVMVEFGL